MRRTTMWTMIAICATALAVGRAEEHDDEREEREEIEERDIEILERTVRLDFKAVPLEDGDEGVYIVTASSQYATAIRLGGDDGALEFEVSGEVRLLDDGRIFVRYEAHTFFEGEDGEAEFHVASGVVLKSGQELAVSRLGDKTLMIGATFVETKSPRKE